MVLSKFVACQYPSKDKDNVDEEGEKSWGIPMIIFIVYFVRAHG